MKASSRPNLVRGLRLARQRGLALPLSLLMLVILLISAAALVRTVDTAVLVSGNLAFKQGATLATERGMRAAAAWLDTRTVVQRQSDVADQGYCARMHILDVNRETNFDVDGWDPTLPTNATTQNGWHTGCTTPNNVQPVQLAADAAGNTVEYMIHRLCLWGNGASSQPGPIAAVPGANQACATSAGRSQGSQATSSRRSGSELIGSSVRTVAYRITVRATGPRGAQSYAQTTVLLAEQ